MDTSEAEALIEAGVQALGAGDAPAAKAIFQRVVGADGSFPRPWLPLARACRATGDLVGAEQALDHILAQQPRHLSALILKGDCRSASDPRAAVSFYRAAVNAAAHLGQPPPEVIPELHRAAARIREMELSFEQYLERSLTDRRVEKTATPRFSTALDIMLGKKEIFLQQPNSFYFPGLPQIQFYERSDFPFLAKIEAAVPQIRSELSQVLGDRQSFQPYVEHNPDRPAPANHLLGDPSWGAFYLWRGGKTVEENAARCPHTMAAIEEAPMPQIMGRSPFALFSRLQPGAHIKPHTGLFNTRLICHIPLIVPRGCQIRVGNETREWEEGKALIFDDSFEHEAWNGSAEPRVVLIFEIWRPEINEDERRALTAMFEAISSYGLIEPACDVGPGC